MPDKEPDETKYVVGGCCISDNDPEFACINCDWQGLLGNERAKWLLAQYQYHCLLLATLPNRTYKSFGVVVHPQFAQLRSCKYDHEVDLCLTFKLLPFNYP